MSSTGSPSVSVIIPCYKATAFITDALESVKQQTFREFEVIVINDGCPDTINLERALHPYRDEIIYIKQDNIGVSGARNTGIDSARAPILAFLDADDIWEPDYLEYQLGFLEASAGIDLVYSNAALFGAGIDEPGIWRRYAMTRRPDLIRTPSPVSPVFLFMDLFPSEGEVTVESLVKRRCRPIQSGVMARRESIVRSGGYDVGLKACEDLDLWIRVAKSGGRFAYHRRPLCRYRIHRDNACSRSVFLQSNLVAMFEKHRRLLSLSPLERRWIEEELCKEQGILDFQLGRRELYTGNCERALEYLNRAKKTVKGRKLWLTTAVLRLMPQLLFRYVRRHYPNEEAFVS